MATPLQRFFRTKIFEAKTFEAKSNSIIFHCSLLAVLFTSLLSYYLSFIARQEISDAIGLYTVLQYSVMGLAMLLAWRTSPQSNKLADYRWLLLVAIAARLFLFAVDPYTSNDVARYLFDGRIALEGLDPYRISHDNLALAELRAQWQPPEEHAKYVTLYPPLALGVFALAATAGVVDAVVVWKAILLGASLLTLLIMVKVLQRAGKLQHLALVALSPLLILEAHVGLHIDTLSTLAIAAALYCWQRQYLVSAGIVIGLGATIKLLPIMLLLPLIFTVKSIREATYLLAAALSVVVGVYCSAIALGFHPVGSVAVFFEKWRFAAPLFVVLENFFSGQKILTIMLSLATITCSLVAYFLWCYRETLKTNTTLLIGSLQLVLALPLILSPVIFPWYLMSLVPLLALYPNRYLILWMLLMPLTYEVIGPFICCQIWQPAQWPVWLVGLLQLVTFAALLKYSFQHWPRSSLVPHKDY